MITIENAHLRLQIAEEGAEMKSLTDLATGREVLWQGDAEFWDGTSPILFPNVGRYWQGRYRYGGREYEQALHGFVRQRLWTLTEQTAETATLEYVSTPTDLDVFPFPFRIEARFVLTNKEVRVDFAVENKGGETMYFQVGGHPGFNVRTYDDAPDDYGTLRVEGDVKYLLRAGEGGCIEAERYPVPTDAEGFIPVEVETFLNEALIFEDHQARFVTLFDSHRRPIVAVTCPSPVTLIWAPQGQKAPFVCVEPWFGLPDDIGFAGELTERRYMQTAEPGQTWRNHYSFAVF